MLACKDAKHRTCKHCDKAELESEITMGNLQTKERKILSMKLQAKIHNSMKLPFHIICLDQCKLKLTHDSMKDGFRYLDPERIIILELPLALKRI